MDQEKLVSVIVPTYKSAQYLYESINSIVNQSYKNLEIIVIDDTPTDDGTRDILDSFGDERIKYIKPEIRLGMVKSLNYAVSLSKGEYVARMDADDISHADRIKLQVEYLNQHPKVGVLGCSCYTINKDGKIIGCIVHPEDDIDIKSKMMFNAAFVHPSVMIRKELLLKYPYNEECYCCEDYELWSRLMDKTEFHNLKQKLFKYRILSGGAMQSQLNKLQQDYGYYSKHIAILQMAYDNVLDFHGVQGNDINLNYVDLTFSKRIKQFPLKEKEQFLDDYEKVIRGKNDSKYVKKCICYQWIKMTKFDFWKTKKIERLTGCIIEVIVSIFEKVRAIISEISLHKEMYRWNP